MKPRSQNVSTHGSGTMKGYILNLTIKGQGKIFDGENTIYSNPGDLLLFSPKSPHHYGRSPNSDCWYHRWVYSDHGLIGPIGWNGTVKPMR